jgi:predicted DNA-binding transcriptional regulator YafY
MRYEKAEIVHRIALDMQGSAEGLALEDIRTRYSDTPLSRRTAERLRDTVERLFPIEHANPGEVPKRWRLRGASTGATASVTAAELADLATAASLLKRENMLVQARSVEKVAAKLRAHLKGKILSRIEPDLEALTEAEGLAMRPGPRPKLDSQIISDLRHAILSAQKVRIHYRYRGTGKRGFDTVHPYGFLYGNRHYLIAWSENPQARDFRNFALANIERVELLDKSFVRKEQFSLAAYAARSFGVFQEKPRRVIWKFDKQAAEQAKEFLFHPTQEVEAQPDGSLIVRFTAGGALEMAWHLYTWGNRVTVLQPKNFWKRVNKYREAAMP